jgi:hypothetical protein
MSVCSISGCEQVIRARGWCSSHYARWHRNGDPMAEVAIGSIEVTAETRKKLSDSHKGISPSTDTLAKRSESLRKSWANSERRKPDGFVDSYGYRKLGGEHTHPLARWGELSEHRKVLYDTIGPGPHPCHWGCGRELDWGGISGIIVDHVNGDTLDNGPENLVPSCTSCNMQRALSGNPADWSAQ